MPVRRRRSPVCEREALHPPVSYTVLARSNSAVRRERLQQTRFPIALRLLEVVRAKWAVADNDEARPPRISVARPHTAERVDQCRQSIPRVEASEKQDRGHARREAWQRCDVRIERVDVDAVSRRGCAT